MSGRRCPCGWEGPWILLYVEGPEPLELRAAGVKCPACDRVQLRQELEEWNRLRPLGGGQVLIARDEEP